jgi:hypothetical protein
MGLNTLFAVCSWSVVPAWLLLIFAPRWKHTTRLLGGVIVPCALAVVYTWLIFTADHTKGSGTPATLDQLARALGNRQVLLASWLHYLVIDLVAGTWEVIDAERAGLPHFAIVPCLIATFFFGPTGVLLYFVTKYGMSLAGGLRRSVHERY